jgi:plastocyanin
MMMRQIFGLLTVVVFLLAAVSAPVSQVGAGDEKGKNHMVEMYDNYFKPKEITIAAGDTITWVNRGKRTHDAASDDKGKTFSTGPVNKGRTSKAIRFTKAGQIGYVCTYHEEDDMKGTIIVK